MIVLTHTALFYNKLAHDTSAFLGNEEFFVRIAGIICEYNPFHNGHAHQLAVLREAGYAPVCVMSGDSVSYTHLDVYKRQGLCR